MRIPEASGACAKSRRNVEPERTVDRGELKEAKGMDATGQNGERVKREPRIRTDRVFARSVFYIEREENENTYPYSEPMLLPSAIHI